MKPIKKIFVFKDVEYKIVKGERNYLEYEVRYLTSSTFIRKRIYKGLAKCNTIEELYSRSMDIVKLLAVKAAAVEISVLQTYLLENQYHYAPKTFAEYQGICRRFETWCRTKKVKPDKIEYKHARDYINYYGQGKKSGSTFTVLVCLKAVYNGLKREGKVSHNHWADVPKIKRKPTSLMYYNNNQIELIREHLIKHNRQLYRAVLLLYSCAIRPGELRHIRVMDVCIEEDFIQLTGEHTKNGKSEKVFVPDQVKEELEVLRTYPAHYYIFGKNGYPSDKIIAENVLSNQHRAMLNELGIRGHYALYSWKHTGAVAMVRAGINLKLIQLHFRHAKLETTNEYLKNLGIMDNMELKIKMPRL